MPPTLESAINAGQAAGAAIASSFLVLHLAAPLTAVVGVSRRGSRNKLKKQGERGANRIMTVGRALYQETFPLEGLLYGGIGLHVASGTVKRISRLRKTGKLSLSRQQKAGYLLVPVVLGHVYTHRILPMNLGISPSLFSYNFVGFSLRKRPIISTITYGALVLAASYHSLAGLRSLISGRRKQAALIDKSWQTAYYALVSSLAVGVTRIALDYQKVPAYIARGYAKVLGFDGD